MLPSVIQQQCCNFSSVVALDTNYFFGVTFVTNLSLAMTLSLLLFESAS